VRVQRGFLAMVQPCPDCGGQGKTIPSPCADCRGTGVAAEEITITLPVPPGVDNGHKLRLDGEGGAGHNGGMAGDLYIRIRVAEHPFFERDGADLQCEVPISFAQAALGASVEVPTLGGKARVKVPAGTQSGKVLRLRGKGLPRVQRSGAGDQLIRLQIETPAHLTSRQKALLEEFEQISRGDEGDSPSEPQRKSFLDKLKDFFD
jgi:molecular chaperone DnaJ